MISVLFCDSLVLVSLISIRASVISLLVLAFAISDLVFDVVNDIVSVSVTLKSSILVLVSVKFALV